MQALSNISLLVHFHQKIRFIDRIIFCQLISLYMFSIFSNLILIIISYMEDISKFVQSNVSLFEQCLLAKDPVAHIRSLPESKEKNILLYLLEPHSSEFKQTLRNKFSIKGSLLQTFDNWKTQAKIADAKNPEQIKYIIDKFLGEDTGAFNYPKPADFHTASEQGKTQQSTLSSKLKPIKSLAEWVEEQLKKNEDIFGSLSPEAVKAIGQDKLMKLKPTNKEIFLGQPYIRGYSDKFAVQFVRTFYEQMQKINKNFEIPSHIFFNLTKNQFILLRQAIPSLINKDEYLRVWFMLNYDEQLEVFTKTDLTISQKDEKRKVLLRILKDLDQLKTTKTKGMKRNIIKQLLVLDISRDQVEKDVFIQYVKDNPVSSSYEKQKFRQQKQNYKSKQSYNDDIELNIPTIYSSSGVDDIIKQSIEILFRRSDADKILVELEEFFQTSKLNKIYATCKLAEGRNAEQFENYLTAEELKALKQSRQITIIDKNKRKWKADDQIQLKVRVKNVNNIIVKIYKIDLQKQFSEGNSYIDQTQNLSYMHPNHSYQYQTENTNPYRVQLYDIKINGIPQGRGVWIVDLEGEGISSRAFIRKGAIVNISKSNSVGTQLKFYDQTGKKITDFTVWMEGKKHNADSSFIIPFGQSDRNLDLIVLKDGFAQSFNVYVNSESYYLDMSYIYNSESFIVGSIAKILLHPRLRLTSNPLIDVNFKLLEKVKILVTFTNNLGIKSTIDFDNVQLKSSEDYTLEFPIQSYTSQINISVQGKVKKYNKVQENITSGHSININLSEGNSNFIDLYLRKKNDGYNLFLLGKNGQPIPRTQVIVQLSIEGRYSQESQNLMTSKDGSINLGDLSNVNKVVARVNAKAGSVVREWSFNQNETAIHDIVNKIYHKGQQITILTNGKEIVELWRILSSSGIYAQNLSDLVKVEDSKLLIAGLKPGRYSLQLKNSKRNLNFSVIGGKVWQNQNKIYDEKTETLYEINPQQSRTFIFGQATFKKQQGNVLVQIPVIASYDINEDVQFRAHLIASNFISPNFNEKYNINNGRLGGVITGTQSFSVKESQYFNNKKLSEESSYVINRLKEKKYIGNNLEKPRLFLKRLEVRDTTQLEQNLEKQEDYHRGGGGGGPQNYRMSNCGDMYRNRNLAAAYGQISQPFVNPLDLTTHNNFFSLPATLVSNQKGDKIQFKIPEGYSHFECLAFSKNTGIIKSYDFPIQQVEIKNLSHIGIQSSGKDTAWTMSREVYRLQKGQNLKVGRDSVWSAIGLSNIIGFSKVKGVTVEDWVINWNTYSAQEKLKIYDTKACHELNAYIKYNDSAFFDEIVKPFIQNKVTKTFVDLCLLDHEDSLKWVELNQLQQLNEFQKVLLVHALVKNGRKEDAQAIASAMEGVNKSQRISFEQFKKEFDTVITAKLTEQAKTQPILSRSAAAPKMMAKKKKAMNKMDRMQRKQISQQCDIMMQCEAAYDDDDEDVFSGRKRVNQPFKQMQKTKQYTQTTYSGMKYPHESRNLIKPSPFWTSAAQHFINGKGDFLTENFMYLNQAVQFTLASCFLPNQKLLDYGLKTQGENVLVEASSSFLIFVREVKSLPFEKKFGVLLNQRFFNPDDRYSYQEDGTRIQKETEQFIVRKPYCIQTLITNTSGTRLQLQLLIDIPEGSMPLRSHQTTRIQSINLEPYSTLSFERHFYFPRVGSYSLYPANACRGDLVIAKAEEILEIEVLENETIKKMDTLENILKSGQKESILQYLQTKNIFDSKIFDPSSILWMLKDKEFYFKVIELLRNRKFYLSEIWMFGFLHSDVKAINQLTNAESIQTPEKLLTSLPIFEYFPYYSARAHKFLNQNKSTIRNKEFMRTYFCYLFASLFSKPTSSRSRVVFIYYLLLQDRIDQAHTILSLVDEAQKKEHQLQFDYIECFIDMYKGYPTFAKARKIAQKYVDYSVVTWQKMFKEIVNTLKEYDSQEVIEEKKNVEFSTTVLNEGSQLRISIPADTLVEVCIYDINLELYFSNFPFSQVQGFCSNIIPNSTQTFNAGQSRQEKLLRNNSMKDCFIEVLSSISGLKKKKVSSFLWSNPNIKINVKEDRGFAQVFCDGKRQPGCYCKVYQMKNGQSKFYRDGYTDITGTFKYALADLDGITEFAILFITEIGGVVERVKPPSQQAYLA